MTLWYKLSDVSLSRNQFDEMIKIFKPISYKIIKENRYQDDDSSKKKIGEVVFIFSSLNSYKKNENFITILFDYYKEEHKNEENNLLSKLKRKSQNINVIDYTNVKNDNNNENHDIKILKKEIENINNKIDVILNILKK
jgi:hypothetical protein